MVSGEQELTIMRLDESDQEDVPLLDREPGFELDVPMPERAMVMVRVEGWVPVDVKPAIVDGIPALKHHIVSKFSQLTTCIRSTCSGCWRR